MKKNKISLQSMLVTVIIGLLMHQYVMSNKFFNYFEMGNIMADMSYAQGDTLQLGRWFLPAATNLFTSYSIPSVNGVILIGCLSLTAWFWCDLFGIKSFWGRTLTGLALLSFPGTASVFSYGVNADAIAMGILLAAAAVYVYEKYRFGFLPGIVLIALSVGIYQPFFAVSIATVYGVLFCEFLRKESSQEKFTTKEFLKKGIKSAVFLLLGFVVYYMMLQVILQATGTNLSDYHGVDDMTSFTPKGIAKGFVYSYVYFLRYFFLGHYSDSIVRLLGNFVGALFFVYFLAGIFRNIAKTKDRAQSVWLLVITALLPLGINAAPFLMADRVGSGVDIYMLFSMMALWALFIKMLEMWKTENVSGADGKVLQVQETCQDASDRKGQWNCVVIWCGIGALVFTIFNGYIICNQAYHRMEAMTETTTSLIERMVARIESMPEWESNMPVYFVNPRPLVNENYQVDVPKYDALSGLVGTEIAPWYNERAIARYMNVYLRFPVTLASEQQQETLKQSAQLEIEKMPSYPAKESIQVIDGVLVVKVSNGEEE